MRHVTWNTGSNMVERMIWADLADTDVLQFEENQDLGLGTQLVKTYKLTQAINLKENLNQGTGILTMREK